MFDFLKVVKEWDGKKQRYVYSPSFVIKPNIKDLMIRSKGLYAIYIKDYNNMIQRNFHIVQPMSVKHFQ